MSLLLFQSGASIFVLSYSNPDLHLELYLHRQDVTPVLDCTFLSMDVWSGNKIPKVGSSKFTYLLGH